MDIVSRKEAKEKGLTRYFNGVPCPKGHITEKLVSNYTCVKCTKEKALLWEEQNKERSRNHKNSWVRRNLSKVLATTRKYQANKKQRIPNWVSKEDLWLLKEAYDLCKLRSEMTNIKHNVDHIVPLQGETVSGFHCIENIQIIPQVDNFRKHNRWDWDQQK
jgi:hypothetical protein